MSKKKSVLERKSAFWADVPTFLREREAVMLRQINWDASIRPSALRTANAFVHSVNFEKGFAEVAVQKVAAAFDVSSDTIGRDLKDLERAGHFQINWGEGPSGVHVVRWILKPQTQLGGFRGFSYENIVQSKTKAGGRRQVAANLRNAADDEPSADLRQNHPQNCGGTPPQICGTNTKYNTQNTQEGGRAFGRAPAGSQNDVVLVEEVAEVFQNNTVVQKGAPEALEGPQGTSVSVLFLTEVASENERGLVADGDDEDLDWMTPGFVDLADLAAEDAAAARDWDAAVQAVGEMLADLHGEMDIDLHSHISIGVAALTEGDERAAVRFRQEIKSLAVDVLPGRLGIVAGHHVRSFLPLIEASCGGPKAAARVIDQFLNDEIQEGDTRHG
ncbi:DeoR family transcriptional regulator [Neogemmobacter tilapiae]|uniref:HTH deoR-type domain-containing protein n=1 Tax=Neogemmobacter tilapiae TaxID=875041 RepID=A0A918WF93_9RHOB|nr:DeoR family transcriptional regulator [Gemmobacter tilapiae]GHC45634.1 hypothetical protein GCM10007315_03890 [Gemmobacter tilapiae]